MPSGWTNDAPAPLLEIVDVADVDVTTDESSVGIALVFVLGELDGGGVAPLEATTDESSVGINCGGVSDGELEGGALSCP